MDVMYYDHPLIQNKLAMLRDERTSMQTFREVMSELSGLMSYEATKDLRTREASVTTPFGEADVRVLDQEVVIVPILRAGLGMVSTIHSLIPHARVGHIGLYRAEDAKPRQYYAKLPDDLSDKVVLLLDPMLATGGTLKESVEILLTKDASDIRYIGIVGCPEGLDYIRRHCPQLKVYLAALDERLSEEKFIVPGLGDAGDRLFGTK